jgi:hypothetical protein
VFLFIKTKEKKENQFFKRGDCKICRDQRVSENIFKMFQKAYMLQKPTIKPKTHPVKPQKKTEYTQVKDEFHLSAKSHERAERNRAEKIFNDYYNLFLLRF